MRWRVAASTDSSLKVPWYRLVPGLLAHRLAVFGQPPAVSVEEILAIAAKRQLRVPDQLAAGQVHLHAVRPGHFRLGRRAVTDLVADRLKAPLLAPGIARARAIGRLRDHRAGLGFAVDGGD